MSTATIPTPDDVALALRAELNASGIPYTSREAHAALHEVSPGIAARQAEAVFLSLSHQNGPGQTAFNAVMDATLETFAAVIRRCFEAFGPADHVAVEKTIQRGKSALVARLRALADATGGEGRA
ncbi:hypothetical protein [Methylobacterium sp. CM6247]